MARWLILAFVFAMVVRTVVRFFSRPDTLRFRRPEPEADVMVLDPQCKSYFPRREAVVRQGVSFCSVQCADQYFWLEQRPS